MPGLNTNIMNGPQMEYAWYDFVGNLGVLCVLGTYFSLQTGRIALQGLAYSDQWYRRPADHGFAFLQL